MSETTERAADRAWVRVATTAELRRARVMVVPGPAGDVAVFWNDATPTAMANICVHRERELARGTIFQGRVICPGHQWAFDMTTGFCAERERYQPVFAVRVDGDEVFVDPAVPLDPAG